MNTLENEAQIMQRACISRTTMWRLRQAGMPCVRIGRAIRYNPIEVMAWLAANGAAIAPKSCAAA
jgi:predicted DNA-binding transcriptional regulator AlpA